MPRHNALHAVRGILLRLHTAGKHDTRSFYPIAPTPKESPFLIMRRIAAEGAAKRHDLITRNTRKKLQLLQHRQKLLHFSSFVALATE